MIALASQHLRSYLAPARRESNPDAFRIAIYVATAGLVAAAGYAAWRKWLIPQMGVIRGYEFMILEEALGVSWTVRHPDNMESCNEGLADSVADARSDIEKSIPKDVASGQRGPYVWQIVSGVCGSPPGTHSWVVMNETDNVGDEGTASSQKLAQERIEAWLSGQNA